MRGRFSFRRCAASLPPLPIVSSPSPAVAHLPAQSPAIASDLTDSNLIGPSAFKGGDRRSLLLDQQEFLVQFANARTSYADGGHPLVVAIMAPGAFLTMPWAAKAEAIAVTFLAGQETGNAFADVFTGAVNPSGRLPLTLPLVEEDVVPPCKNEGADGCAYLERLHVGWRALVDKPVAFRFGHGLSFSTFNYKWLHKPSPSEEPGGVSMRLSIENAGPLPGAEIVQLYVAFPPSAGEPPLVLRAFNKTAILQASHVPTARRSLSASRCAKIAPVPPPPHR